MAHKLGQLTAPGDTDAHSVNGNINHTVQIVVAAINTTVDYNVKGSLDDVTYFDLTASDVQVGSNGTYRLTYTGIPLVFIKGTFAAEAGGTAANVDFIYQGQGN